MSDNTQLNSPTTSGDIISTDDLGGVKVQNVKMAYGPDGSMTRVDTGTPLPVVDATAESALAAIFSKLSSDPATQTTLAAILAKLISAPATAANQATEITSLANLDVALSTRTKPADQQHAIIDSGSLTANAGANLNTSALALETGGNLATIVTNTGKIPALGQAAKAAAVPVVQASDQIVSLLTGQATQTATVNNILPAASGSGATDVSQYRSFATQIISTGSGGTFIFEGSVDNTNFVAIQVQDINPLSPGPLITAITASSSNKIYVGACPFPYLRLRIATTITGGSIQAFSAFSPNPLSLTQLTVAQGAASNLNTLSVIGANASAAETTTNPTTGIIRSVPLLFNGVSWDRQHGNWNTTTGDTGAKIANGNGATQTNYDSAGASITLLLGTVTGTFTTFQIQLQYSPDAGTTWLNLGAATTNDTAPASGRTYLIKIYPGTLAANTSGANASVFIQDILPRTWRIQWVIAGVSPSATFTAIYVNYNI